MTAKPIHIVFTLLLFAVQVKAQSSNQTSVSLGIGVNNQLNQNDFSLYGINHRRHIDASLIMQFERPITNALHVTASLGYVYFDKYVIYYLDPTASPPNVYQYEGDVGPFTYFPVTAGFRYYLLKHVYAAAEAGSAFEMSVSTKTSFIYAGGAGVAVPFGNHNGLDFGFKYERGYKYLNYSNAVSLINISISYKYRF